MDLFFKLGKASDNVADVGTSVVKSTNNASENAMNVALNKRFLNQLDTVGDQLDNVGDHLDNIPLPGGRPPRLGVSDVPIIWSFCVIGVFIVIGYTLVAVLLKKGAGIRS